MTYSLLLPMLTLVVGTYTLRATGVIIGDKIPDGPRSRRGLEAAGVLLLAGVMTTSTVSGLPTPQALTRLTGVVVASCLALRGRSAPLALVAATVATATLRLCLSA